MSGKSKHCKFERTSTVIKCMVVTIVPGRGYDVNEKWRIVGERCAHNPCLHEYMLESLSSGEKLTIYAAHTRFDAWATQAERKKQSSINDRIGRNKK